MTKPLGYYTSYVPGDGSLLEELQDKYGAYLERMSKDEKAYYVLRLTSHLYAYAMLRGGDIPAQFINLRDQVSWTDSEGLLQALITYIREVPSSD